MGADFYSVWVANEADPARALAKARAEVLAKGVHRGEQRPQTPTDALRASGESGTGSILDIEKISAREEAGAANGLDRSELLELFSTEYPTRQAIESCDELVEGIDRGCARYVAAYENGTCIGIVFLGYSFD